MAEAAISVRICAATAAATLALCAAADRASGFVYWASPSNASIGRANPDGEAVSTHYVSGLEFPCGVAVDHAYVYWADAGADSIGRARIDGTQPDGSFISGADSPCAVAVDSGHVYWANTGANLDGATIGRAALDGSDIDQSFIGAAAGPCGLAVDNTHVYWTNASTGTIGRAELDGSDANPSLIAGVSTPCGLAVTGGAIVPDRHNIVGGHVYWANTGAGFGSTIGRASLDGGGVEPDFVTGLHAPLGLALSDTHVLWSSSMGTIGHAYLDGSAPDEAFIPEVGSAFGLTLDAGAVRIAVGSPRKLRRRGIARLPVTVPGPGTLSLDRTQRVRADSADADAAGRQVLTVKARGRALRRLDENGSVRVTARVAFAPNGLTPVTESATLKLARH